MSTATTKAKRVRDSPEAAYNFSETHRGDSENHSRANKEAKMIVIVRKCQECPCLTQTDDNAWCNASTPKGRPVDPKAERPSFCPLRREQIIIREFQ